MIYLDLFSGAGGGSLGIKRAIPNAHCKGHFEIDPDACKVLSNRFPGDPNHGSVVDHNWKAHGHVDLIIAGSPCTDLSIIQEAGTSGKTRKHLEGESSKLFFCFVEALEKLKPKHFLLENVASMSKEAKDEISKILGVQPIEINSSLVSAQNRPRLYWCNWEVTQPQNKFIQLQDIKLRCPFKYAYAWSKSTRSHPKGVQTPDGETVKRSFDERLRQDQKAHCLTGSINGSEALTFFSSEKITGLPRKVFKREDLLPYKLTPGTWRKLFPIEAERLQTFPDGWCIGVSMTAAYRLMGNAMTVDVIKHIIKCNKELMK